MKLIFYIFKFFISGRELKPEIDVASALSGNSLVGKKNIAGDDEADEIHDGEKYESKMLLFNGLYFRGSWETPFQVYILIKSQ